MALSPRGRARARLLTSWAVGRGGGGEVAPEPIVPLASTVTNTFTYDGVTYNLSAATRVGYTVTGEPVVEWQPALALVSTSEPSFQYTQTTPVSLPQSWVSGAEWRTGRNEVYGIGQDLGGASAGQPFDQRVANFFDGRNVDPGRTGAPFVFPGAGTLAKTVYRPGIANTSTVKVLNKYQHIHVVTTWPNAGCYQPNPWSPAPGPANALFASDITLDGLQSLSGLELLNVDNLPAQSVADSITILREPMWHGWTFSNTMRCFRGGAGPNYGREIARFFNNCCAYLMGDVATAEQKRQIAEGLVARALDVAYRVEQGGLYQPGQVDGGHQSPWGPLVLVAAALTRNSVRGQVFRDILTDHANSTSSAKPLGQSLRMTRAVTANDWRIGSSWGLTDSSSTFRATPRRAIETNTYWSLAPRSWQEGAHWGSGSSGGLPMNARHPMLPYGNNAIFAPTGMWWLVDRLGQRSLYPDAHMWPYYDYLVRTQRGFAGTEPWTISSTPNVSYTRTPYGELRSERNGFGDRLPAHVESGAAAWQIPAQAAPTFVRSWAVSNWVNRETRATDLAATAFSTPVREHWVTLEFSGDIAYDINHIPPASCFTVNVNGSPAAIDTTGAITAGDPRTNGAIRIFRNRIAVAITAPIEASDTVTIAADWSGAGTFAPRLVDGQLLPSVTPSVTAENRTTNPNAPALHDAVSWGYGEGSTAQQLLDDPHKRFGPAISLPYLNTVFGINTTNTARWSRMLVLIRNLRIPNSADLVPPGGNDNLALFGNVANRNNSQSRRLVLRPTTIEFRGGNPGVNIVGPNIWTSSVSGLRVDVNLLIDFTDGARQISASVSIDGGPWTAPASGALQTGTWTVANSVGWSTANDFIASLTGYDLSGAHGRSGRGVSWGDLLMHIEQPERLFGTLPALNSAQMTGPLGSRGQNVLPARPDYTGRTDGGIPEFYYRATLADAQAGAIPNSGLFEPFLLLRQNGRDPELGPEPFVSYGSGS